MNHWIPLLALVTSLTPWAGTAAPVTERWVVDRNPSPEELQRWEQAPAGISVLWNIPGGDPAETELKAWEPFARTHGLSIRVQKLPMRTTHAVWKTLARHGVEMVAWDLPWPSAAEMQQLAALALPRLTWVALAYPSADQARAFGAYEHTLQFTFAHGKYPRTLDRDGLKALPVNVPLLFLAKDWPWYDQMDLLNLIPQVVRLRIHDIFPSAGHWTYLEHIKRLREIQITSDYPPPEGRVTWERFGSHPVAWSLQDTLPEAAALRDFCESAPPAVSGLRRLILDRDFALTPEERTRLEALSCPTEWIHGI